MIRGKKALFLSFTIHALIALFAVELYRHWPAREGVEIRYKVALSCLLENAAAVKATCSCASEEVTAKELRSPKPQRVETHRPVSDHVVTEKRSVPKPAAAEKPETAQPVKEAAVTAAEEGPAETADAASAASAPAAAPSDATETAGALPAAASAEERYLLEHIRQIALLLRENLYYPRIARKRGITGDVTVAFELLTNGEVRNVAVITQAHPILNRAAVTTIERLSGEFPKPDEPLTLQVPINYRLQ
jgi:protein TonB